MSVHEELKWFYREEGPIVFTLIAICAVLFSPILLVLWVVGEAFAAVFGLED